MIGFHTSEIQLWSAISRGQKPLNRQIRALSENFKASSSESWTTWIVGAGASLTIWAGDCPPEADEPPVIFAKLGAIFYADLRMLEQQQIFEPQTLKMLETAVVSSTSYVADMKRYEL